MLRGWLRSVPLAKPDSLAVAPSTSPSARIKASVVPSCRTPLLLAVPSLLCSLRWLTCSPGLHSRTAQARHLRRAPLFLPTIDDGTRRACSNSSSSIDSSSLSSTSPDQGASALGSSNSSPSSAPPPQQQQQQQQGLHAMSGGEPQPAKRQRLDGEGKAAAIANGGGGGGGGGPGSPGRKAGGRKGGKKRDQPAPSLLRRAVTAAAKIDCPAKGLVAFDKAVGEGVEPTQDTLAHLLYLCAGGEQWEGQLRRRYEDQHPCGPLAMDYISANVAMAAAPPAAGAAADPAAPKAEGGTMDVGAAPVAGEDEGAGKGEGEAGVAAWKHKAAAAEGEEGVQAAAAADGDDAVREKREGDLLSKEEELLSDMQSNPYFPYGQVVPPVKQEVLMERGRDLFAALTAPGQKGKLPESAFTAMARISATAGDADEAFRIARSMAAEHGVPPKLRSFTPALIAFCTSGQWAKAFEVDAAIASEGLELTEEEYADLLGGACSGGGAPWERALAVLHRMARELTVLQPKTLAQIERYFRSEAALSGGGGGWALHPSATVDSRGVCSAGAQQLRAIDIDDAEWGAFADGIARLAEQQEKRPNDFKAFQAWLERNGPFDCVMDGANVALYGQNFATGGFSFSQIEGALQAVARAGIGKGGGGVGDAASAADVQQQQQPGGSHQDAAAAAGITTTSSGDGAAAAAAGGAQRPERGGGRPRTLLVMHVGRVKAPPARHPKAQALIARLKSAGCMYSTPPGSNDDWYWLYAAVKAGHQGLLLSNDEMRDHIFQLLAPRFFHKWKQRHQLRYHVAGNGKVELKFPPPFTRCIQLIPEDGSWVFPAAQEGQWLCVTPNAPPASAMAPPAAATLAPAVAAPATAPAAAIKSLAAAADEAAP